MWKQAPTSAICLEAGTHWLRYGLFLLFAAVATAESGMNNPNRRNSSAGIFRQLFIFLLVSFATI
jgi:hypothetical protein